MAPKKSETGEIDRLIAAETEKLRIAMRTPGKEDAIGRHHRRIGELSRMRAHRKSTLKMLAVTAEILGK